MKRVLLKTAMLMSLLWLPFAAFGGMIEDMIAFDRAYIPALALTTAGKLPESKRAMDSLNTRWAEFRKQHAGSQSGDKAWSADIATIDRMIREADDVVASGVDLGKAHEALEHVRFAMLEMRSRNKVPYYLDALTRFHEPMEVIALAAKDKTAATFGAEEIAKIGAVLPVAERRWADVKSARVDAGWRLTHEQQQNLAALIAKQSTALDALKQALESSDRAAIMKAALAIKPGFACIYMSFGDFDAD